MKKAIDTGRIHPVNGRLDPKKADADWDRNTRLSRPTNSVTGVPSKATPKRHRRDHPEETNGHRSNSMEVAQSFAENQAKHEGFKAELARLKVEEQEGRLIDAEAVREEIFKAYRAVREGIRNIPNRISAIVAAESDPAKVHRLLISEIDAALESLNEDLSSEAD